MNVLISDVDYSFIPKGKICLCNELIKECRCNNGNFIPFIVETPKPYLMNLGYYKNDKVKSQIIKRVKNQVSLLLDVLDELNIGRDEAIENDYSLNESTKIKLMYKAWEDGNLTIKKKIDKLVLN